jgi:hypothetical protein
MASPRSTANAFPARRHDDADDDRQRIEGNARDREACAADGGRTAIKEP